MDVIIIYPEVEEDSLEAMERTKSKEMKISGGIKTGIAIQSSTQSLNGEEETGPVIDKHDSTEVDSNSDMKEEFHAALEGIRNYKETNIKIQKIETIDINSPLLIQEIQDVARSKQSPLEAKPLMLLCRFCAIPSNDMIHIFGPTAFHETLLEKIQQCLPITVKETDTLPTAACRLCLEKLEACYQFNTTVIRAEMELRSYHEQMSSRLDEEMEIRFRTTPLSDQQHIIMQNAFDGSDLDESNQNTEPIKGSLKLCKTSAPHSEWEVCNSATTSLISEMDSRKESESDNSVNHPLPNMKKQPERQINTHQGLMERSSYSLRKRKPIHYNIENDRDPYFNAEIQAKSPVTVSHCDKCNNDFDSETALQQHMLLVHDRCEVSSCKMCGTQLGTEEEIDSHQKKHALQCILCGHRSRMADGFRRHRETCFNNKQFTCDYCGKVFKWKISLTKHIVTHIGGRSVGCDYCSKTFISIRNRDVHHRVHTGERPFKCDHCSKTFISKIYRNVHHRVHTGERPYKCDYCSKTFTQKSNLNTHLSIHTGKRPHSCDLCPQKFVSNSSKNRHRITHTREHPFSCDFCKTKYQSTTSLRYHMKQKHRET